MPVPRETKPSLHRLLPDKYFRWRAGEITRLEAFSDVVFGFAITLLVVSLEVPHSYVELMQDMRGFLPFAVCFAQLVLIWYEHYSFSRRYGLEDGRTVLLNVTLLFVVLFYVYPLKFLFTLILGRVVGLHETTLTADYEAASLMRIYASGWAAVFALFTLLYWHAHSLRKELELNEVETYATRTAIQRNLGNLAVGVISFGFSYISPSWAGWSYFLVGVFSWIHGTITGRRMRRMAERG
jgi:uncharacterized membrane protein